MSDDRVTCDWVDRTAAGDVQCGSPWTVRIGGNVCCAQHMDVAIAACVVKQISSARDVLADECDALRAEAAAAEAREAKLREALQKRTEVTDE